MNSDMLSSSVLVAKAAERSIPTIARASPEIQLALFKDTLADLEDYLDTGDLSKLNEISLGIIRNDILEIIRGVRSLSPQLSLRIVSSVEGILENLRLARDNIQFAIDLYRQNKRKQFYETLRIARGNLAEVLRLFSPLGSSGRLI
jgi:hypothetical protein